MQARMISEKFYTEKAEKYFAGLRRDIIDRLTVDTRRIILEIGCGDGSTGAYAKKTKKCGVYVGVELFSDAAHLAKKVIDEVHIANIENFELPFPDSHFDVLIASEVLEHLIDPWSVLRRLHAKMKIGGRAFASSPNIAHISTLRMLIDGRWDLDPSGRMDRTHFRWFTPRSYRDMFEQTGYEVLSVEPLRQPVFRARIFDLLTFKRFSHLFVSQIFITAIVK
jgi:2-polyprenyl-3-methyl-5-hydroxy-6-metoxy-1,4-benzoquinol methylase